MKKFFYCPFCGSPAVYNETAYPSHVFTCSRCPMVVMCGPWMTRAEAQSSYTKRAVSSTVIERTPAS